MNSGHETTLIFLPGMMLDASSFQPQISWLEGSCHIRVADTTRHERIEDIADSVIGSAPCRFALVGLSMGGIVALDIATRFPHRVTHLGLLDTTPLADRPERRATRERQMTRAKAGELRDIVDRDMASQYFVARDEKEAQLRATVVATAMSLGPDVFIRQSLALRDRPDYRASLTSIGCPTLVLCGKEDRLCSPEVHRALADDISGADLTVLAGAGHLPTLERPSAVNSALQHLLSRSG